MNWVVSYDYPIENRGEMKMESVRIENVSGRGRVVEEVRDIRVNSCWNQKTKVSVIEVPFIKMRKRVHLDLAADSRDRIDQTMIYTPDQARELAAALIRAAECAENEEDEQSSQ